MANFTLARRDSYLDYLHAGVKQDTVNALRTSPVRLNALFPDQLIAKAEEEISKSEERRLSGTSHRHQSRFHPYAASASLLAIMTRRKSLLGNKSRTNSRQEKSAGKASTFSQKPAKGQKNSVFVTGQGDLDPAPVVAGNFKFECRLLCCKCSYCHRVATKERRKSQCMSNVHRNKICESRFLCRSLVFCKSCHQCPTCCYRSSCRGEVTPVLGEMGSPGFKSKSSHHTEGGLHSPVPVQTQLDKVTDCNKQLPQSSQTVLPFGGTVSADKQKCSRTGRKSKLTGFLQPASFGTQTQQPVETSPGPEHLEHLFKQSRSRWRPQTQ